MESYKIVSEPLIFACTNTQIVLGIVEDQCSVLVDITTELLLSRDHAFVIRGIDRTLFIKTRQRRDMLD
jgi:hypothetical protein